MKKVAFVAPTYPVLSETFIRTEVESIKKCGHDVCVFTFEVNKSKENYDYEITKIGSLFTKPLLKRVTPKRLFNCLDFISKQKSMPKRSLFLYSVKLASQMAMLKIEHVHAHFAQHTTTHSIAAAKLIGIPCSFVAHGHDVYESPFDVELKIKSCNFVVSVCQTMEKDFKNIESGNTKLLHCGVNTRLFKPKAHKKSNYIHLVFLGRLVEQKGVQYLLQSLKTLCRKYPIKLDIVGNGDLYGLLKQQVISYELTDNVRFLGAKQHDWVKENLSQYDCLVAPFCVASSGCVDTGPLVLKEAMAVGLPVITTNIMGCKEIVSPNSGFLVEEKNHHQLTQTIEKFVNLSATKRHEMGEAARKNVVDNFDAMKQAKILSGWIETCDEYSKA